MQALSEQDRTAWMDIMDGKEPVSQKIKVFCQINDFFQTYTAPANKIPNSTEESYELDDVGRHFVKRCIEVLEKRGLEEQGIYR